MPGWIFAVAGAIFFWLAVFVFYKLISRLVDFFLYGR
jgi:hypothetical protein